MTQQWYISKGNWKCSNQNLDYFGPILVQRLQNVIKVVQKFTVLTMCTLSEYPLEKIWESSLQNSWVHCVHKFWHPSRKSVVFTVCIGFENLPEKMLCSLCALHLRPFQKKLAVFAVFTVCIGFETLPEKCYVRCVHCVHSIWEPSRKKLCSLCA